MKTALPTIGIRPTIDGRRLGVRESLEDQTMNMAKAAAALIEANIRHASGEPVKCVIADTCISGAGGSILFTAQLGIVSIDVRMPGGSRRLRGQIQGQQRRRLSGRYALLVLRQ
jgi:hypothetical protein